MIPVLGVIPRKLTAIEKACFVCPVPYGYAPKGYHPARPLIVILREERPKDLSPSNLEYYSKSYRQRQASYYITERLNNNGLVKTAFI
jgi:hypothetical protein